MTRHTGSDEGLSEVCRNCARPITFETRTEPGYLPREGWYDDCRTAALVCFKAVSYRHVPLGGRERAIYDAGLKAARGAAPDALTPASLAEALHEHRTGEADPGYRFPLDRQPRDYRERIEAEATALWPAVLALINGTVGDIYAQRD